MSKVAEILRQNASQPPAAAPGAEDRLLAAIAVEAQAAPAASRAADRSDAIAPRRWPYGLALSLSAAAAAAFLVLAPREPAPQSPSFASGSASSVASGDDLDQFLETNWESLVSGAPDERTVYDF